jgi:hypothetical protein
MENSEAPVHIDLYTRRKLRRLFGDDISIQKYQCAPLQFFAPWFGWFLVVRGQKT